MYNYEHGPCAPDFSLQLINEYGGNQPEVDLAIVSGQPDMPPSLPADGLLIVASDKRRPGSWQLSDMPEETTAATATPEGADERPSPPLAEAVADDGDALELPHEVDDGTGPPRQPPEMAVGPSDMPDPMEVARRAAQTTGDPELDPDFRYDGGELQRVFFDVENNEGGATANVIVQRAARNTGLNHGQEVPLWVAESWTPVGHYDPAVTAWRLYDELILPQEQLGMADTFEALSRLADGQEAAEESSEVPAEVSSIDLRHPLTTEARREMADYIKESALGKEILQRSVLGSHERLTTDVATSATFVLAPVYQPTAEATGMEDPRYDIVPEQYLAVAYQGLIQHLGQFIQRTERQVILARRSDINDEIWIPDPDLVTFDEWRRIAHIPSILQTYRYRDSDFSPEHCAVMRLRAET